MAVANAAAEAEAAAANAAAEGPARAMAGKAVLAEAAERWIRPRRQTCGRGRETDGTRCGPLGYAWCRKSGHDKRPNRKNGQ